MGASRGNEEDIEVLAATFSHNYHIFQKRLFHENSILVPNFTPY